MAYKPKICTLCGAEFTPRSSTQKYCYSHGATPEENRRAKLASNIAAREQRLSGMRKNRDARLKRLDKTKLTQFRKNESARAVRNNSERRRKNPELVREQRRRQSARRNERATADATKRVAMTEKYRRYRDRLKQDPEAWERYLQRARDKRRRAALRQLIERIPDNEQNNDA